MTIEKKRGGLRANAGRNIIGDSPTKNRAVSVDDETHRILSELGGGKFATGVRIAAKMIRDNQLNNPNADLI